MDLSRGGSRVLRDVCQRLGHQVVGRRFNGLGQGRRSPSDRDRSRSPAGQRPQRRIEPAVREDRGVEPARQLAQLRERETELL